MLGSIRAIGLNRLLGKPADKHRALGDRLDRSRLISPASKLAARARSGRRDCGLLGRLPELGVLDEVKLCRAHDWLGARQPRSRPRSPAATSR